MSEEKMSIVGCMDDEEREIIKDALFRRMAELDPHGLKAGRIKAIIDVLEELPTCEIQINSKDEADNTVDE